MVTNGHKNYLNIFSLVLDTEWSLNSRNNFLTTCARMEANFLKFSCFIDICLDCNACDTAHNSFCKKKIHVYYVG